MHPQLPGSAQQTPDMNLSKADVWSSLLCLISANNLSILSLFSQKTLELLMSHL